MATTVFLPVLVICAFVATIIGLNQFAKVEKRVTAAPGSDTQRLDVTLHVDSKPDTCNNRVSKWLSATLGSVPEQRASNVPGR